MVFAVTCAQGSDPFDSDSPPPSAPPATTSTTQEAKSQPEDSDSDAEQDGDLAAVKPGLLEECKMVRL